jgi:hypothetical protein
LLDKEAIFVKEELKRSYQPKLEIRVRLTDAAKDEAYLHKQFTDLARAQKQLALLMKYLELSHFLSGGILKEVSKKELIKKAEASPAAFNGLVEKKYLRFTDMK